MLSPRWVARPNPSCPTQCRQDTTPPWSTDHGGNIYSSTLILMPAVKLFLKEIQEKRTRRYFLSKKKQKWKNEKHESGATLILATPNTLPLPPCQPRPKFFHKRKSSFLQEELLDVFLLVLASARTSGKRKKNKKKWKNKRKCWQTHCCGGEMITTAHVRQQPLAQPRKPRAKELAL